MRKRFLVLSAIAFVLACGGNGDIDDAGSEGGTETGADACEEARVEPTGCEGVQFPGDGSPRTAGVVLAPDHSFYQTKQQGIIEFYAEDTPVCGDICRCEDEDFVLVLTNSFAGPGIYSFDAESEDPVILTTYTGRQYKPAMDECAYMIEDAASGTLEVLSVGESCIAGVFADLPAPFDALNGPWMAGSCE